MKAITAAGYEWGADKLKEDEYNPYSKENILERFRQEGEIQSAPPKDKILCYDPKRRDNLTIQFNRAWLDLPGRQKSCVYGKFVGTQIVKEDGNIMTAKEVAKVLGLSKEKFDENWGRGVTRISGRMGL